MEETLEDLYDCKYAGKMEESEREERTERVLVSLYDIILEVIYDNIPVGVGESLDGWILDHNCGPLMLGKSSDVSIC